MEINGVINPYPQQVAPSAAVGERMDTSENEEKRAEASAPKAPAAPTNTQAARTKDGHIDPAALAREAIVAMARSLTSPEFAQFVATAAARMAPIVMERPMHEEKPSHLSTAEGAAVSSKSHPDAAAPAKPAATPAPQTAPAEHVVPHTAEQFTKPTPSQAHLEYFA